MYNGNRTCSDISIYSIAVINNFRPINCENYPFSPHIFMNRLSGVSDKFESTVNDHANLFQGKRNMLIIVCFITVKNQNKVITMYTHVKITWRESRIVALILNKYPTYMSIFLHLLHQIRLYFIFTYFFLISIRYFLLTNIYRNIYKLNNRDAGVIIHCTFYCR